MGANSTQAGALVLFLVAFTLIAVGLAADISYIALLAGLIRQLVALADDDDREVLAAIVALP